MSRVGSGAPLVCLGGGPGFPAQHLGTLGGLHEHRTLLLVDVRGAGTSDPPHEPSWSIDDYVEDLHQVWTAAGAGAVDVFGHSHGGFVAAAFAARFPEAVVHLVLDGTPVRPRDLTPPEEGIRAYFFSWDADARRYSDELMASMYEEASSWFVAHEWETVDLASTLPQISAETLVITGEADWACGAAAAETATHLLQRGRTAVIEEAGHFAWRERPDAYRSAFVDFLGGPSMRANYN